MTLKPTSDIPPSNSFKLTRFFSTTSLIGIVIVTVCLIWTYRELTVRHLIDHESRANADLTRVFANTLWDRYHNFVLNPEVRSREVLLKDPVLPKLREDVLAKMKGLPVVKIKIYNPKGLTVFSTDESQIGDDKSANEGFLNAMKGKVSSQITYREKFDAYEGELNKRNLISSYIPVRTATDLPPEGVVEVYSDVTELLQRQNRAQWEVAGIVLLLLATLYLFLFFLVRRADRIIADNDLERTIKEEEVRHLAYHDALTGLPNRTYFTERLGESIALTVRHGHSSALMFIDLDRFKIVNDSLGHQAGDELLKTVSARISSCLRNSDLLFRMGGDEFTVILPEIAKPEDAALLARRIIEAVGHPAQIYEHELTVGATIGLAVYPGDGENAEALLKNADAAMYSAKESGRGTYAFYRANMNQRALQRLSLEADLQKGFHEGEFTLYYQPRLDAATGRVVALEALLRWNSPSRGVVLPMEFISVLEDTGMITIVGEWVLRSACIQIGQWRELGNNPVRVSVNVSALQFQSTVFVSMIERVIDETDVAPELIELELTESLLVTNTDQARETIDKIKALGLSVSIDDFGSGYSSLNYLRNFTVDYLKIDRSFVAEIATNERDRSVARAIIELAKALDIAVVAEGVETEAQANFFSNEQCGELQGFLFSKPLPADQLQRFLDDESKVSTIHPVQGWNKKQA